MSPSDQATQGRSLNPQSSNATKAYPRSTGVNTTLSFLVPSICFLSSIPAGLAYWHTPSRVKTTNDSDFYQLISGSGVQVLAAGTLILSVTSSARLVGLPRIWLCVLTGTSIICTIVSIPLYLRATTALSGLLSFCGNVAQILALLQLPYSL